MIQDYRTIYDHRPTPGPQYKRCLETYQMSVPLAHVGLLIRKQLTASYPLQPIRIKTPLGSDCDRRLHASVSEGFQL